MPDRGRRSTGSGFGRVLVVYALFAVAATARSLLQLATRFDQAPIAYLLSAAAAVVYVVATVALATDSPRARRVAAVAIGVELGGVLAVGALSAIRPQAFPAASVWSGFGSGYLFVPLVLPLVGLWWLWFTRPVPAAHAASTTS